MEVTTLIRTVGLDLLKPALPQRQLDGHKGTFGKLLIVGGAVGYTGAPLSHRVGGGTDRLRAGVAGGAEDHLAHRGSQMCLRNALSAAGEKRHAGGEGSAANSGKAGRLRCAGAGTGAGPQPGDCPPGGELLKTEKPLVLDADGINALSGHIDLLDARRGRPTVLTPHEVEFARIGGDLSRGDRERAAQDFAMAHGCVLVLKGHRTVTASPEGDVLVNTTGGSGLAKGGSGDVLTGVIASLMAQRADALRAAAVGVWLHGRAGDLAEQELTAYSVTPEDVVRKLPDAIREILE